jgi:hypothetical protein
MFSAFHHFRIEEARAVLADAVRKRQGIAVFEGTHRSARAMLLMLLVPLMVLLITPFIRPFRWSRLFWTYLIPVVPLVSLFDGLVSCLRTYSVEELCELTEDLDAERLPMGDRRTEKHGRTISHHLSVECRKKPALPSGTHQGYGLLHEG